MGKDTLIHTPMKRWSLVAGTGLSKALANAFLDTLVIQTVVPGSAPPGAC